MIDPRLVACGAISIAGHIALTLGLDELPERETAVHPRTVEVRVIEPPPKPPDPEPEKPPEPLPPPPKVVHERPRVRPNLVAREQPVDAPVIDQPLATTGTTTPVFGVTMQSTSSGGKQAVATGNTARPTTGTTPTGPTLPLAAPAAAYEVTKMPVPQGRCSGKYTEAAREASLEGTVILDLVVDETGRSRDIKIVTGLGHGLTEAAIAALRSCRFTPGEKDGKPVAVRVRSFKIRFLLDDA